MSVDYRPDYDPADVDHNYGHTGGDITVPTFTGDTRPFRFWCQKALPLVYDDSLSYYEVLCKMADYLNNFMTDLTTVEDSMTEFGQQFVINQQFLNSMADQLGQNVADLEAYINDRMDDFMTAYTQLQTYVNNYFDNLDVQEEINTKLDEMASDGTLNDLFDPVLETWMQQKTAQIDAAIAGQDAIQAAQNARISVLEGRMDTFSGLPSGSTSGNAELLDIRTNFLGETYPTAGDAVRASDMIASGFQSISATYLEEWNGNAASSVYDSIQIDVSGYKGGHVAVIGTFLYFLSELTELGKCSVYGTNTAGAVADSNAANYYPGGNNSIFTSYTKLTTSISGEERLLMQFAIPDDYAYQYLKIGNFEHGAHEGTYTKPLYIVYANSWSKTQVDPTLSIAGAAADAKAAGDALDELNERIGNVSDEVDEIDEAVMPQDTETDLATDPISGTCYNNTAGTASTAFTNAEGTARFVEIDRSAKYYYTGAVLNFAAGVCFYKVVGPDKVFISSQFNTTGTYERQLITFPDEAVYFNASTQNKNTKALGLVKVVTSKGVNDKIEDIEYKIKDEPCMNHLYVATTGSDTTGDGSQTNPYASILKANSVISDNSETNRYTIHVADGTYTDMQTLYAGTTPDGQQGIGTKDYVYYEGNVLNPSACVLQWDGANGYTEGSYTYESYGFYKCIFHVGAVHTAIRGFKLISKNTRYCLHIEMAGLGMNADWEVSDCILSWLGTGDCTDRQTSTPVIGTGSGNFEHGHLLRCKIDNQSDTVDGWMNHDSPNYYQNVAFVEGANIIIEACDFDGTNITFRNINGDNVVDGYDRFSIIDCTDINIVTYRLGNNNTACLWRAIHKCSDITSSRFVNEGLMQ